MDIYKVNDWGEVAKYDGFTLAWKFFDTLESTFGNIYFTGRTVTVYHEHLTAEITHKMVNGIPAFEIRGHVENAIQAEEIVFYDALDKSGSTAVEYLVGRVHVVFLALDEYLREVSEAMEDEPEDDDDEGDEV